MHIIRLNLEKLTLPCKRGFIRRSVNTTTGADMTQIRKMWPTPILLMLLSTQVSAAQPCPLVGPNLLLDPDFAIEEENPSSNHWSRVRHAGINGYQVEIAQGELTIKKIAPQHWLYYGQRVAASELKGVKMAFTAELKLDMTPVAGQSLARSSGGLDIFVRSASGSVIWSSRRNHEPRLGKTDWETVQVVFIVPPNPHNIALNFMHEADGTMQVRHPSFRQVDETEKHCAVTPDRPQAIEALADPPLR